MTDLRIEIADVASELADPHQHREKRWTWSPQRNRVRLPDHVTVQDGLVVQLYAAVAPAMSAAADDRGGPRNARSAPPLQLEALGCYLDICTNAADWMETLGLPLRPWPEGNIRALAGTRHGDRAQDLLGDLKHWRNWAATMTGWQSIYTPRAACPFTECPTTQPGTLRVNLTRQTAYCTACESWWDEQTIGILAAHIENTTGTYTIDRPRVRSGAAGHGGWASRETNGASA